MGVKVTNNAFGTLSAGISTSDTTITLDSGQGARFPSLSSGDYFFGTVVDTSNNLEIVKVTARSSDSMTVVRGQDNTTAQAFAIGDRFELRPTAALFEDIIDNANVDGITSSAAGTAITIDSSDDVTVENDLTVSGELDVTADVNPVARFSRGSNNTTNVNLYYNTTHTGQLGAASGQFEISAVGSSTPLKFFANGSSRMTINADGEVVKPSQPAFLANGVGTWEEYSTDAKLTFFTSTTGTGGFNIGNHYSTTNNRFTCPVDGVYLFMFNVYHRNETTSDSTYHQYIRFYKNGSAAHTSNASIMHYNNNGDGDNSFTASIILDLDENDYIELYNGNGSGAGSYYRNGCYFCGYLLG